MSRFSLPALVAALLLPAVAIGEALGSEARRTAIVEAIASQRDAVVNIHGQKLVPGGDPDEDGGLRRVNGMGTGIVVDPRGYIVTNFHVVEGVKKIEVTMASGESTTASLVSHDLRTDLAVIKVQSSKPLPVIRMGTSSDLMIAETVIAIGNAYGYEHTVTRGIISALHRGVEVSRTQRYDDLIQTDASINPGNSGGPLLNIDGEMIGVNVAVRAGAQGIGFAIPVDQVVQVVTSLLSVERVDRTWHGIVSRGGRDGVVVTTVHRESPAETFGVRAGDTITSVGDLPVSTPLDVERAMLGRKAGERVPVTVTRSGGPTNITLTLAAAPSQDLPAETRLWQEVGVKVEIMTATEVQKLQARYRGGLRVLAVRVDGPAADEGIRAGDILVGLHVWETISQENVIYVLDRAQQDQLGPLKFYVLRGGETLFGHLTWDTLRR